MDDRLAILVHELRSPVAALVAIADALTGEGQRPTPEQGRRLLELAIAAGAAIERLLADDDLYSVRHEQVDVRRLLEGVAVERVTVDVPDELVVHGDAVRLRQAVGNLVANALRHGDRVHVRATPRGDAVAIDVEDDGPGVPAGLDVFAAGVSGVGSTGYGLAIARSIAERHGGRLEHRSTPGAGARFTLVLPSASG